jgi:hypothetical protein
MLPCTVRSILCFAGSTLTDEQDRFGVGRLAFAGLIFSPLATICYHLRSSGLSSQRGEKNDAVARWHCEAHVTGKVATGIWWSLAQPASAGSLSKEQSGCLHLATLVSNAE